MKFGTVNKLATYYLGISILKYKFKKKDIQNVVQYASPWYPVTYSTGQTH